MVAFEVSLSWAVVAVLFVIAAFVIWKFVKNLLVNSVLGVLALLAINHFGASQGLHLQLNFVTLALSAFLGLAGVGIAVILALLGVKL